MNKNLFILGSVMFLAACSGGGNGVALPPANDFQVDPSAAPTNPASASYIKELFKTVRASSAILPRDAVIFSETFYSEYVSPIGEESRQAALKKLSDKGLQFVDRIKANCNLSKVDKVQSQDPETAKTGDTVSATLSQSSSGSNCEFLVNKKADITTLYREKSSSMENGVYKFVDNSVKEETETENKEILNPEYVAASGIKSIKSTSVSKTESESLYQDKISSYKYSSTSSSSSETVLSNGQVIRGTGKNVSKSISSIDEQKKETQESESASLTKISTPGGEIWMGYSRKGNVEEHYINGRKMTDEERAQLFAE